MGDLVLFCALALTAGLNLFYSSRIRATRVPMQWGLDGKPTWYAPKIVGLWGALLFVLATRTGIYAMQVYDPDRIRALDMGLAGMGAVLAVTQLFLLRRWSRL